MRATSKLSFPLKTMKKFKFQFFVSYWGGLSVDFWKNSFQIPVCSVRVAFSLSHKGLHLNTLLNHLCIDLVNILEVKQNT